MFRLLQPDGRGGMVVPDAGGLSRSLRASSPPGTSATRGPAGLLRSLGQSAPALAWPSIRITGTPAEKTTPSVNAPAALSPAGAPLDQRPYAIRGTYTDEDPASGDSVHPLATAQIPAGYRFQCLKRVVLLDTTAGAVRGGVRMMVNSRPYFDGSAAGDGITSDEPGEFMGAVGLEEDFKYLLEPGDLVELTAVLRRGADAVTVTVQSKLIGYLVPAALHTPQSP